MRELPDVLNGIPITFTLDEERKLRIGARHMLAVLNDRADGWRIEYIANLQVMNKLVYGAVNRGKSYSPN